MGATPSGLVTSAHLHHPPYFYRPDVLPAAQPTASKHRRHPILSRKEMSTGQCGDVQRLGIKAGMLHSIFGHVWLAGKTV